MLRPVVRSCTAAQELLRLVPFRSFGRRGPERTSRSPRAVEAFFASSATRDPSHDSPHAADVSDRAPSLVTTVRPRAGCCLLTARRRVVRQVEPQALACRSSGRRSRSGVECRMPSPNRLSRRLDRSDQIRSRGDMEPVCTREGAHEWIDEYPWPFVVSGWHAFIGKLFAM